MKKLIWGVVALGLTGTLTGCSDFQAHANGPVYAPSNASSVQILYDPPQRPYQSIGIVSAKRYKPGWTDPTVSDAIPQLQAAGAQLGADAVIVKNDQRLNDRHVVVEGEAIKFTAASNQGAYGN